MVLILALFKGRKRYKYHDKNKSNWIFEIILAIIKFLRLF